MQTIEELLGQLVKLGGSDLHITAGSAPLIRIDGKIRTMKKDWDLKKITGSQMDEQRVGLDDARDYFREKLDYLLEKYKRTSESGFYKRRRLLKSCFYYFKKQS